MPNQHDVEFSRLALAEAQAQARRARAKATSLAQTAKRAEWSAKVAEAAAQAAELQWLSDAAAEMREATR